LTPLEPNKPFLPIYDDLLASRRQQLCFTQIIKELSYIETS
jgi:hypothetical protein